MNKFVAELQYKILWWWRYSFVRSLWWKIQHRFNPRHRYHVIKTTLKPGYYDPRERILHGVMSLVVDFVDSTKSTIDWQSDQGHAHAWQILTQAYNWWVNEYPNWEDQIPEGPDFSLGEILKLGRDSEQYKQWKYYADLYNNAEAEQNRKACEHLQQIMSIIDYIWYP